MSFSWLATALRTVGPKPKTALVLGGGGARGFAHIGVLQELERHGVPIDLIVGASVGSLIGAIFASDGNSRRLEAIARVVRRRDLFDYSLVFLLDRRGLAKGEKLQAFVESTIPATTIEQLKIPFAAVATDLRKGERVILDRGALAPAVRASCAIPGVFVPVEHQGRLLVDGWVLENLPVDVARELGADIVIAVDISMGLIESEIDGLVDVIIQSISIMAGEQMKHSRLAADVLITPDLRGVGRMEFDKKDRCMAAGVAAARIGVPEIREKIASWQRRNWWRRFVR